MTMAHTVSDPGPEVIATADQQGRQMLSVTPLIDEPSSPVAQIAHRLHGRYFDLGDVFGLAQ